MQRMDHKNVMWLEKGSQYMLKRIMKCKCPVIFIADSPTVKDLKSLVHFYNTLNTPHECFETQAKKNK